MGISVAIPNYNGLDGLKILLPALVKGRYRSIYLLDDASTDRSVSYAKTFEGIVVIEGRRNLGPGGNRNRILQEDNLEDLLWFIDADMELLTSDAEVAAKELFEDPSVAVVGGKIMNRKGKQMYWNYGYEMHPLRDRMSNIIGGLANRYKNQPNLHNRIRRIAKSYFFGLEIEAGNHPEHPVEWVAEGNFLVRTEIFRRIGGFDENMRYHEAHDFCKRIRESGMVVKFSPEIVTRHLDIDCRDGSKNEDWQKGRDYFFRKHWGTPRKAMKNFFRIG